MESGKLSGEGTVCVFLVGERLDHTALGDAPACALSVEARFSRP
jgi:hypothetical protein